jgi:hypothetical protein
MNEKEKAFREVTRVVQSWSENLSAEEAEKIINAAIDASFEAIKKAHLSLIPKSDPAVFRNFLLSQGLRKITRSPSNDLAVSHLLTLEEYDRQEAEDEKIVISRLGEKLSRKIGGHLVEFKENRNGTGQWRGSLWIDGKETSAEWVALLSSSDPERIKQRDEILALYAEGESRLEKLDPSYKARAARIYLDVPFAQKDTAKSKGAKWDAEKRKWYAPTAEIAENLKEFRKKI